MCDHDLSFAYSCFPLAYVHRHTYLLSLEDIDEVVGRRGLVPELAIAVQDGFYRVGVGDDVYSLRC